MVGAYMRRQRWNAKLQAVEMMNMLGEAMGGGDGSGTAPDSTRGRIPAEAMLARMSGL
jgi:hypothetical protein